VRYARGGDHWGQGTTGDGESATGWRVKEIRRRVLCDWLDTHTGPIESYGHFSYVACERCGRLRQPMPRYYAEFRFGTS